MMNRRFFILITFIIFLTSEKNVHSTEPEIPDSPDNTFLWNEINALTVINGKYTIGIADDAIVVCKYVSSKKAFDVVNVIAVNHSLIKQKSMDSIYVVQTADFKLLVYSLQNLPEMELMWTLDPGIPFADYAINRKSLFLTSWFDGLWRYVLDGYGNASFADSSMVGVLCTQLQIENDTLYMLDNYNGILRYKLGISGPPDFIDYLYVLRECNSFIRDEENFILLQKSKTALIGNFGLYGSGIIDSIVGVDYPRKVIITPNDYVFWSDRYIHLVDRINPEVESFTEIFLSKIDGDILINDDSYQLLLPNVSGGFTIYPLDNIEMSIQGLNRPGPINSLVFHEGKLFTGGETNPLDVFDFNDNYDPDLSYTIYDDLKNIGTIKNNGDTLIVYYSDINRVAFIKNSLDPDSFYVDRSFSFHDSLANDFLYVRNSGDTLQTIISLSRTSAQPYILTDSGKFESYPRWNFTGNIISACYHDSLFFVSTSKKQLWTYLIDENYNKIFLSVFDLSGLARKLFWNNRHLLVSVGTELLAYNFTNPAAPYIDSRISLPLTVVEIAYANDALYAIGPEGIAVFNIENEFPELLAFGGDGGSMIAVWGDILAASDGGSIKTYQIVGSNDPVIIPSGIVLSQNYPNPFNNGTTIQYSLSYDAHVKIAIYNVLGRQVKVLVDEFKTRNNYEIFWDGTNKNNQKVASGVYLYRMQVGDDTELRKMVFVK
ncbi:MAG: T9SS type A sorting domain-containing protein [bacterium]